MREKIKNTASNVINLCIALVWLINGLYCKLLGFVPRHQLIVARISGTNHAVMFTKLIGLFEVGMFVWVISKKQPTLCAMMQIALIAVMNVLEFFLAPDLLLFGKWNSFFAVLLIGVILVNEFALRKTFVKKLT